MGAWRLDGPRHITGSFPILFVFDKDGASGTGIAAWHRIQHREGDYDRRIRDIFETWRPEILLKLVPDPPLDFRPNFRATDYALIECQRSGASARVDDIDFVTMNRRLAGFAHFRDIWDAIDRGDVASARAIILIAAIADYIDRYHPGHQYSNTLSTLFVSATVVGDSLDLGPVAGGHWKRAAVAAAKPAGTSAVFYVAPDTPTDIKRLIRLPGLTVSPATAARMAADGTADFRAILETEIVVRPASSVPEILDRHWASDWRTHLAEAVWEDYDQRSPSTRSTPQTAIRRPLEPTREPYFRHRHSLQSNFTGRVTERRALTEWLTNGTAPVLCLTGIGGMGKSSLLWVWLQRDVCRERIPGLRDDPPTAAQTCQVRASARPAKIVWWSFSAPDNHFEAFVDKAIAYISDATLARGDFSSLDEKVRTLVDLLAKHRVLMVLDAFEYELSAFADRDAGALRDTQKILVADYADRESAGDIEETWAGAASGVYDAANLSLPSYRATVGPHVKLFLEQAAALPPIGRVLISSRVPPEDLDFLSGVQHMTLGHLSSDDAAAFLRAEGLRGRPHDFERVAAAYGHHPLALRLVARRVARHPRRPGDVTTAEEFDPADVVRKDIHIVAVAYDALDADTRHLLSGLAAFRSPAAFEAIQAAFQAPGASENFARLQEQLDALVDAGMVQFDRDQRRYELHAIIRRYAYERLGGHERRVIHERLANFFAAQPVPKAIHSLDDLIPTIERFHHRVGAMQYDAALRLYMERLSRPLYRELGAYHTCIELLSALMPDGPDSVPKVGGAARQRWVLNTLAAALRRVGNPRQAVVLYRRLLKIRTDEPPVVMAMVRQNLADQLRELGKLKAALEVLEISTGDLLAPPPTPTPTPERIIGNGHLGGLPSATAVSPAPHPDDSARSASNRQARPTSDVPAPMPTSASPNDGDQPALERLRVELPYLSAATDDDVNFDWYGATIHDDELSDNLRQLSATTTNAAPATSQRPAHPPPTGGALCRAVRRLQAAQRIQVGRLRSIFGEYDAATADFVAALAVFDDAESETSEVGEPLGLGSDVENLSQPQARAHLVTAYRGMVDLLRGDVESAISAAKQSHKLARSTGGYNIVRADWLVGETLVAAAQTESDRKSAWLAEAKPFLVDALAGCRRMSLVSVEPQVLLAWARWHRAAGEAAEAKRVAEEALAIADRCDYRLVAADVQNFFAQVALAARDYETALPHAAMAEELAECDGGRFVYHAALTLARQLRAAANSADSGPGLDSGPPLI